MCCDLWGPGKREARQGEHKEMMKKHTGVERRQMLMECSSKIRGQSVQELLCTSVAAKMAAACLLVECLL